jgi:hypothetical protein
LAKLITVQRATDEIKRLQHFVNLVESYDVITIEKWIINEYAYTNSIIEGVRRANSRNITNEGLPLDRGFVTAVIKGKPSDELDRLMQSGYKHRIKINKVK